MNKYIASADELCTLSATELAAHIRNGDVSASEVTEAHIRQIETVDKDLNAVVIPLFDQARAQAEELDKKRNRGEPLGALHGVPVTIKEQFRVTDTDTTIGVLSQVGKRYESEGPLVTKLRQAGVVILGKTNIIQTLAGWESDNRVYGRTNNPWNLARTPGGSSGGESAIIAAGGSPLGLAGDLGGSIRIPAHFCGLHGLKPTSRRLTNDDFPTGLLSGGQETIIPQPGPIARSVADLNLAMEVLAKPSKKETRDLVPPVPWPDLSQIQVEKLKVGIYTDNGFFPASPAIRRSVEEAANALDNLGAAVDLFTPPDVAEGVRIFLGIMSAAGGAAYKRLLDGEKPVPQIAGNLQGMGTPNFMIPILEKIMIARGQNYLAHTISCVGRLTAEEYWNIVEECNAYRARFIQALDHGGFDALICPPFALPAPTHGSSENLFPAGSYANIFNVLGNPAGVLSFTRVQPGEESDRIISKDLVDIIAKEVEQGTAGLPIGVQVIGRHWREDVVLAIMAALEKNFSSQPNYPIQFLRSIDLKINEIATA